MIEDPSGDERLSRASNADMADEFAMKAAADFARSRGAQSCRGCPGQKMRAAERGAEFPAVTDDHSGFGIPTGNFELDGELFSEPQIVGVQKSDVIPIRYLKPGIAAGGETTVSSPKKPDSGRDRVRLEQRCHRSNHRQPK